MWWVVLIFKISKEKLPHILTVKKKKETQRSLHEKMYVSTYNKKIEIKIYTASRFFKLTRLAKFHKIKAYPAVKAMGSRLLLYISGGNLNE